jgi:hypothetical protein
MGQFNLKKLAKIAFFFHISIYTFFMAPRMFALKRSRSTTFRFRNTPWLCYALVRCRSPRSWKHFDPFPTSVPRKCKISISASSLIGFLSLAKSGFIIVISFSQSSSMILRTAQFFFQRWGFSSFPDSILLEALLFIVSFMEI